MGIRKQGARKAGIACGAVVGSALLALSTATTGGAASSALVVGGISTPSLHDLVMSRLLGGAFQDRERISVNWPAEAGPYTGRDDLKLGQSINIGVENLNAEIDAALARLERDEEGNVVNGETVTVVGLSAGSLVVTEVLREMAADPDDAPESSEINFVVVADSSRQELIRDSRYNPRYDYTYQPAPATEYDTVVVTGEYDGLADFPDRPWNLLAVANAIVGSVFVHVPVMFTDLTDVPPEYITTEVNSLGGSVTNFLVPSERLPLVQLLPFLEPSEAALKAMVDRGYSRNDDPGMPPSPLGEGVTATSATSALSAPTVTDDSENTPTSLRRASARAAVLADESPRSASGTSGETSGTTEATAEAEPRMATSQRAEVESAKSEAKSPKAKSPKAKPEAKSPKASAEDDSKSNARSSDKAMAKSAKDSKASSTDKTASTTKSASKSAAKSGSKSSDAKKNTSNKRKSAKAGSR